MRVKTLITRYKNLGYKPKGLERDLEITGIIKWIFETYNYAILYRHVTFRINEGRNYLKFVGGHISNPDKEENHKCWCSKGFNNPQDALYDAVRDLYSHLSFMGDTIKVKK